MRVWLLCLWFLIASSSEILVLDHFETAEPWIQEVFGECSINVTIDQANTKEGETSLRMDVEFAESCTKKRCYASISREVPDLREYAFLRLWVKVDAVEQVVLGIHARLFDEKGYSYTESVSADTRGWQAVTAPFSEFESDDGKSVGVNPEEIETISLFVAADEPQELTVYFDGLVALTDVNDDGIPDVDEPFLTVPPEDQTGDEEITGLLLILVVVILVGVGVYVWKFRGGEGEPEEETGTLPGPEEETGTLPGPEEETGTLPGPEEETGTLPGPEEETGTLPEEPQKPQLTCPKCKNIIKKGWVACPYCGEKLIEDTQVY